LPVPRWCPPYPSVLRPLIDLFTLCLFPLSLYSFACYFFIFSLFPFFSLFFYGGLVDSAKLGTTAGYTQDAVSSMRRFSGTDLVMFFSNAGPFWAGPHFPPPFRIRSIERYHTDAENQFLLTLAGRMPIALHVGLAAGLGIRSFYGHWFAPGAKTLRRILHRHRNRRRDFSVGRRGFGPSAHAPAGMTCL